MDDIWQDIRFAFRALRRDLGVTLIAVLSVALAIGGNMAVFSMINGLLFRPLPFVEPEQVVLLGEVQEDGLAGTISSASAGNYLDWRERQSSFEDLAAYASRPAQLAADGDKEQVTLGLVSPQIFPLLGIRAASGRLFAAQEGRPGADALVVLDHGFWQERFAADPEVLGSTVEMDGTFHQVVGILPEGFEFLDPSVKVWKPQVIGLEAKEAREQRNHLVVARLAPQVTMDMARAEMTTLAEGLAKEYPEANRGYTVSVLNLRHDIPDARNRQILALLQGALIFVLLIACVNVANLLLARGQAREREIAVRTSLGAGRVRIVRQLLTEGLLMGLAAGSLGLLVGAVCIRVLFASLAAAMPSYWQPVIDWRVSLFTLAVSAGSGVLFGLTPAFQTFRFNLVGALKDGGRSVTLGGRGWARTVLVVGQICMAMILLGGAAVMVRTLVEYQRRDPGFETAKVLTFVQGFPQEVFGDDNAAVDSAAGLAERLAALPGVQGVAMADSMPRSPFLAENSFIVDSQPPQGDEPEPRSLWIAAHTGYFEALGIELRQGRTFSRVDRADSEPVILVNESFARRFLGDGDPMAERVTIFDASRRIVGVVEDIGHAIISASDREGAPIVYLPLTQRPARNVAYALRTEGPPLALADAVRQAVSAFDSNLTVTQVRTLDDFVGQFFVGAQVISQILAGFGALALLLAALGTYGVLAYTVSRRFQEIGVRMALGARRRQVMQMVARQGLLMACLGLLLGIPGAMWVAGKISGLLSDFSAVEPATVFGVGGVLLATTLLASALPAHRAASVDPVKILREE